MYVNFEFAALLPLPYSRVKKSKQTFNWSPSIRSYIILALMPCFTHTQLHPVTPVFTRLHLVTFNNSMLHPLKISTHIFCLSFAPLNSTTRL